METTKTKQQIRKEIKRLEAARTKEYKKISAKYKKALDHMDIMEDREEKKHPEKFEAIYRKYRDKGKKIMDQWFKYNTAIHEKYEPKIEKLYVELRSAK